MLKSIFKRKPKELMYYAVFKYAQKPLIDGSLGVDYPRLFKISSEVVQFAERTDTHIWFNSARGSDHLGSGLTKDSQTSADVAISSGYRLFFDSQDDLDFFIFNFGEYFEGFTIIKTRHNS